MKKYKIEIAHAENFTSVTEWFGLDDLPVVEAVNAREAASHLDLDGDTLIRVCELVENEFGVLETTGDYEFFECNDL